MKQDIKDTTKTMTEQLLIDTVIHAIRLKSLMKQISDKYIPIVCEYRVPGVWIPIDKIAKENLPLGEVLGFNEAWINEDFQPDGIRMCNNDDLGWVSAKWCSNDDCYTTPNNGTMIDASEYSNIPTHIQFKPNKP